MTGDGGEGGRHDLRPAAERRVRRAWREGPDASLRVGAAVFGLAGDLRNFAYETGLVRPARAPIPVVSVGGLTVGGGGKTPVTTEIARRLGRAGHRPAVVSRGFQDEMAVHRRLLPEDVPVLGHRIRLRGVRTAARAGNDVAVLDDAFQHRRLERDVEVLVVDADLLRGRCRRRLPAGPFRDRWSELGRADAVVVTRRSKRPGPAVRLTSWLRRHLRPRPVIRCALRPGQVRPFNETAARASGDPRPAVALAGIMKPGTFLRQVRTGPLEPEAEYIFADHAAPDPATMNRILEEAGDDGIVTTLKDAVRLEPRVGERTPVWYLQDRLVFEEGEEEAWTALDGVWHEKLDGRAGAADLA